MTHWELKKDKIIELREKRKYDEVMMRLDLDRERHEADVKRQNGMLQFQKEQVEKDDSFRREQLAMQLQQIESQKQQSMLMKFMMENYATKVKSNIAKAESNLNCYVLINQ